MGNKNLSIFSRNVPGSTDILQESTVGIAGCGGLGSNAAVALVRAGVGNLILVDFDRVEVSNLNRQYYFQSDIGKIKVEALAGHLRAINPDININMHAIELSYKDTPEIFKKADLLIEAFDNAESKRWLIESWCSAFPAKAIICGSGLGGIGRTNSLVIHSSGNIYFCGDEESDSSMGLCSSRISIVAGMQANIAISLLTGSKEK
ncbi:sulfur carrier protein ThiS adenylyltransferase ThiF [bacterium]|nr:sulfur carrier protein ThiS adenylyltransferase ThiF [bacterium]